MGSTFLKRGKMDARNAAAAKIKMKSINKIFQDFDSLVIYSSHNLIPLFQARIHALALGISFADFITSDINSRVYALIKKI